MSAPWTNALEWRIAWRHLRVGETHPRWVDVLSGVAVFLLVIGLGLVLWAAHLGPEPEPGEQLFSAAVATAQQRQFGVFGGLSLAIGSMLLVLTVLARFFNLLATIISMSVLLGCMALVVVLSLMSGLEADLRDKILNQKAHIRVSAANGNRFTDYHELTEALAELPEVAGASPYLEAEIMVRSGINRQGAVLLGVEPQRLLSVSNLPEIMREGSFDALTNPAEIPEPDPFGALEPETPWRLRHLDKNKARGQPKAIGNPSGPPKSVFDGADGPAPKKNQKTQSKKTRGPKLAPSPYGGPAPEDGESDGRDAEEPADLPDLSDLGDLKGLQGPPRDKPTAPSLPPPPPELVGGPGGSPGPFGPTGIPGFVDDGDDGWEDPVEVLGLEDDDEGDAWGDGGDGGDGDDGGDDWEDPSAVLDLPGEDDPPTGDDGPDPEGGSGGEPQGDGEDPESDGDGETAIVDPILLGRELANELAVSTGARVQLITPVGRLTPAGRVPGILATKVGGVFHSGMYEYDRKNVYIPLDVAQAFLRTGDRISGIEVKLHDVNAIDAGKASVEAALRARGRSSPYLEQTVASLVGAIEDEALRAEMSERYGVGTAETQLIVESWKELNRNLFSAMLLEKIAMFVALLFVVLVASFGILASNLMSVIEKSKEIAILKAMGAQDQLIQRVFVAEGLVLGVLGAVGGITMGLVLCWALDTFGFPFNENVYYIERLPVVVNPLEVVIVGVAALVIVWLSSLYPARVASRMQPIDGLRQQEK